MKRGLPAFTLIEMSIVLIIVGVIMSFALPALTTLLTQQRHKQTAHNQELVLHALAAYVNANGCLPCPTCPPGSPSKIGLLPYRLLGLPESCAKDGFNTWMTYAVSENLVNAGKPFCPADTRVLEVQSEDGRSVLNLGEGVKDIIAVVLISHGPEGHGAFLSPGGERIPVPEDRPLEALNADETYRFVTAPYVPGRFQHKVVWVTRNNLMAVYAKNPCRQMDANDFTDKVDVKDEKQPSVNFEIKDNVE